ncbi:MAG: hypothetical protein R3B72_03715 [Polyangiaceae bacterium]
MAWLLVLLVGCASGCNAIFGVDGLVYEGPATGSGGGLGGATSQGGGPTGGATSGGGTGGAGGSGATGGGGSERLMGTDDAIVRYFIDEEPVGLGVGVLRDALPMPVDLTILDPSDLTYVAEPTGRGLRFGPNAGPSRAAAAIQGTKLAALAGSTQWTVELVVTIEGALNELPRLLHMSPETQASSQLAMRYEQLTGLITIDINDSGGSTDHGGIYDLNLIVSPRVVLHGVMDTSQVVDRDRLRVYADGLRLADLDTGQFPVQPPLTLNEPVTLSPDALLVLGNRGTANRVMQGVLAYAAIYRRALTDTEIEHNAAELLLNDDP